MTTGLSEEKLEKKVAGVTKTITVRIWNLPRADFDVAPVALNLTDNSFTTLTATYRDPAATDAHIAWDYGKLTSIKKGWVTTSNAKIEDLYELSNVDTDSAPNSQSTSQIRAKAAGTGTIKATVAGTAKTRPTTKYASVTIVASGKANVISMDSASKALVLKEGETAQLKGTASVAGKTVTFQGGDAAVATVTTAGAVTAVKAGQTTIKAVSDGADSVEIPVVVVATQKAPAAVTGVKVSNKKGAKVSVKWVRSVYKELHADRETGC